MSAGAICGGPLPADAPLVVSPHGWYPEPMIALGERYRYGARCHIDDRFLSDVEAIIGPSTLGDWVIGHGMVAVVGTCRTHGRVEGAWDEVDWGDY